MGHGLWLMDSLVIDRPYDMVRNVKPRYIMVYLEVMIFLECQIFIPPYIFIQVKAQMKQFKIYEAQIRAILQRNLLPINYLSDSLIEINKERQSEGRNGSLRAQSDCEWQQAHKISLGGRIFEIKQPNGYFSSKQWHKCKGCEFSNWLKVIRII